MTGGPRRAPVRRTPPPSSGGAGTAAPSPAAGGPEPTARALALRALLEIEGSGGRANVVVPARLADSGLSSRDRAFVTELVYGSLRMQRACDWLIDQHVRRPLDRPVRAALRLGAYQLAFLRTPPHAAVSATVAVVNGPARGLVNAVLRRVAHDVGPSPFGGPLGPTWPNDAVRLSYPDWIIERLTKDLGPDVAPAVLEEMNRPAGMTTREDGYVQDPASQWAAGAVGASAGERVIDLCAAPGGKASYMAYGPAGPAARVASGGAAAAGGPSIVVAADVGLVRAKVIRENATRLGLDNLATVVADGLRPPFRPATFDRALVDAPCSGLGVLRRRPDARWRIQSGDVGRLAELQRRLLETALGLVRPGGLVVYSVCTLTGAETTAIDEWLASSHPEAAAVALGLGPGWMAAGRGARLLPTAAGTDGMFLLAVRPGSVAS